MNVVDERATVSAPPSAEARALIDQAVAQGLPRNVRDPVALARVAAIVSSQKAMK